MKEVILKQIGIQLEGTVKIIGWYNNAGYIEMNPVTLDNKEDVTNDEIKDELNDGGFGCQSIEGAIVDVFILFENGYKELNRSETIGNITDEDLEAIDKIYFS